MRISGDVHNTRTCANLSGCCCFSVSSISVLLVAMSILLFTTASRFASWLDGSTALNDVLTGVLCLANR